MLHLLLFLAAINATAAPDQGRYLHMGENVEIMGLVDAATLVREGDRVQVMILGIRNRTRTPANDPAVIIQVVQETDCATRRLRDLDGAVFDADLKPLDQPVTPGAWEAPPAGSPGDKTIAYLCDGVALPEAGSDFRTLMRAYWLRTETRTTDA